MAALITIHVTLAVILIFSIFYVWGYDRKLRKKHMELDRREVALMEAKNVLLADQATLDDRIHELEEELALRSATEIESHYTLTESDEQYTAESLLKMVRGLIAGNLGRDIVRKFPDPDIIQVDGRTRIVYRFKIRQTE